MSDTWKMIAASVAAAIGIAALEFAYRFFKAPAQLHKKAVCEANQAQGEVVALKEEKSKRPRLQISLGSSAEVPLVPCETKWVNVLVNNMSDNSTVRNVQLFVESISPPAATKIRFPALVSIDSRVIREFIRDRIPPLHSEPFALVQLYSNTPSLNVQVSNGDVLKLMEFQRIEIRLKATADDVRPAQATLILSGPCLANTKLRIDLVQVN